MPQKQPNYFLKFTGMAVQMGLVIGLSAWLGQYLDGYFSNKKPVYTILLSLLGIGAAMYLTIKDLIKPKP